MDAVSIENVLHNALISNTSSDLRSLQLLFRTRCEVM